MHCRVASLLTMMLGLISSSVVAQPAKHAEAEKALARIVLEKDFGDDLQFHSREVVTTAQNDRVPGLNGLMFMRWKGDGPGTVVMASVQWFEKKDDLLKFYAKSTKRADYTLGEFDGTTLWKIGEAGYSWTDGEHFLISLGGSADPPKEMVKAWLAMIASKVAEVEKASKKESRSHRKAECLLSNMLSNPIELSIVRMGDFAG